MTRSRIVSLLVVAWFAAAGIFLVGSAIGVIGP